jgi:hypothetical protein
MAHTLGNSSTRANSASTTITTATFTPDSGVTCLVLKLWVLSATSRAGGAPTYNGVTMSQAGSTQKAAASPEVSVEIWYLTGAAAAVAATASIPNSGALTIHYTFCTGKAGSGKTSAYESELRRVHDGRQLDRLRARRHGVADAGHVHAEPHRP